MAELLVLIHNGKAVSPAASERMNRALGRSYWDNESLSQIPSHIHVPRLSKQGAVNQSKSEVVLGERQSSGAYVFCLITKNQQDTRWVHENEGYIILRHLSSLCLNYFEPTIQWKPVQDMEKFSPINILPSNKRIFHKAGSFFNYYLMQEEPLPEQEMPSEGQ